MACITATNVSPPDFVPDSCSLIVVWLPLRTVRGSSDQSLVDLANRVEHLCRMARPESILSRQFKINSSPMLNPLQTEFLGGTGG
jgi:hypothetical protein